MFLRKSFNKTTGRTYLSIVHSYWNSELKKTRASVIKSLGYLDELEKLHDDPIAFFTAEAKRLEEDRVKDNASFAFKINKLDALELNTTTRKNFGYVALSKIYHELGIHAFLTNRQRHTKEDYDADTIMKMLVFSRLLKPASKKKSFEQREYFFEKTDYSLDDVYRCLSFLNKRKDSLKLWINNKVKELYGRDTSLVYYDVTNYYFETDILDDFRKKGVSKEHRPNPIVQMGLFMDNNGLPITYKLFPGNTNDCLTYRPNLFDMKKEYGLGKVVVVADKGMTTGDNIWYTLSAGDGYVFSMSVRGANRELKDYVLSQEGYLLQGDDYKHKSRLYPREIKVTATNGRKLTKTVHEKQVVFYSEKYAKRARSERVAALEKAMDLIKNPGKYTRATSYGAAGYVHKLDFDKETGEVLNASSQLSLNEEKLREDEALDGYYVLITSEYEESDNRIIDMYRGLWKIEESFRVTKSDLEARPVYVSSEEHIEAHFLTCFVALVIARVLEMRADHKHSISKLLESLGKCECSHIDQNYYLFDYYDQVLLDIGMAFSLDFSRKMATLGDIKKNFAATKK